MKHRILIATLLILAAALWPGLVGASAEETAAEEKEAVATLENGKLHLPGRTTVVLRSTKHYDDVVINPDSITTSPGDEKVQTMDES